MIFTADRARDVKTGAKTQTRRPIKPGERACRYKPGRTYAVQPGRGKPEICRIEVTHVERQLAGQITHAQARAEGFRTTDDFKIAWVAIHDKSWLDREHAALDKAEQDPDITFDRDTWIPWRSLTRFDDHHADTPVWAITFTRNHDAPRLLALRSDELYTTNTARAMADEPEAVDEDAQNRITENAGTITSQWQTLEQARRDHDRDLLSREAQIARLHRAARLRSIDIRRETWALESMLNTATPDNFNRKVRKTEQRVFGIAA